MQKFKFYHLVMIMVFATFNFLCSARTQEMPPAPANNPQVKEPNAEAHLWQLSINTQQKHLLTDEALVLCTTLQYQGAKPFQGLAFIDPFFLVATIAANGKKEELFVRDTIVGEGVFPEIFLSPQGETYAPGTVIDRPIALAATLKGFRYLFHEPGQYTVQLRTFIWQGATSKEYKGISLTSNPITIEVTPVPEQMKPALELWRGQEQAQIMSTVNSYYELSRYPEGTKKLQELKRLYPTSPYAITVEQHFRRIGDPAYKIILFAEDKRLDAPINVYFPDHKPREEIFAAISKQTGVPLDVADEYKKLATGVIFSNTPLRTYFEFFQRGKNAEWIKQGNGYKLVPATKKEPRKSDCL